MYLAESKGYPFRASLTKRARCAACQHLGGFLCRRGKDVQYPLYSNVHSCPAFKFKPLPFNVPQDCFNGLDYPECANCGHNFRNICSGKRWIPVQIKDGKCEFFRDKKLICKYAIPYSQYCNHLRNNYCRLPPHLRDQEKDVSRGWSWNCNFAHIKGIECFSCYKPKFTKISSNQSSTTQQKQEYCCEEEMEMEKIEKESIKQQRKSLGIE